MSLADRDQRLLARQRAGLRKPEQSDFAINFEAQPTREERRLMRVRAGNRQVDNIDFGFSFTSPRSARVANIKSPQSEGRRSSRSSARKTRAITTSGRLSGSFIEGDYEAGQLRRTSQTDPSRDENGETHGIEGRIYDGATRSAGSIMSGMRRTSNAPFAIAEEVETSENHVRTVDPQNLQTHPVPSSPLFIPEGDDKENQIASKTKFSLSSPTRTTYGVTLENILRSQERNANASGSLLGTPTNEDLGSNGEDGSELALLASNTPNNSIQQRASSQPAKKRRKRKSVILVKKKRGRSSLESLKSSQRPPNMSLRESIEPVVEGQPSEPVVEEDTDRTHLGQKELLLDADTTIVSDTGRAHIRPRTYAVDRLHERRGRKGRLSISPSAEPVPASEREEDETYVEPDTPEPTTPAPIRKVKPKRKRNSEDVEPSSQRTKRSRSSFPILTYRMTNLHSLPIIAEERDGGAQESDTDEAVTHAIFKDRATPNAIDVLAQICRETIEAAIEKLDTNSDGTLSRTDIKRRRAALEKFGNDLDQRLFDMSETLENRQSVEARLRKSKREKADLQAQYMEIRRQRDAVALRIDAVRRQNWQSNEEARKGWEISELAHNVELELDRGGGEEEGLEYMLRTTANQVSSAGDGGGALGRIRAFNSRLERIALSLGV